jgi:inorganic pyrophosphatase
VATDTGDPWAAQLNDIDDVERVIPGCLNSIREWFRLYKVRM